MYDKCRQFGVDLFLVSGYSRKIKVIPSAINHVIFGYIHCPQVSHYILERGINESHFVNYVDLHRAILHQVASDFQIYALKENEKTLTMFSKVMDNCGSVLVQSARNVGEQHSLLTPTFDFLVSNLTFFKNEDFKEPHEIILLFINGAVTLLKGLVDFMPKPIDLMDEGEEARDNKTTGTLHQLMVEMTSTPVLGVAAYSTIVLQAHEALNEIALCEMYEDSAIEQMEIMRKLAWVTGVVAESIDTKFRDDLAKMMSAQFTRLIKPKFREQVDLRCDAAFMLHKTGFVPKEKFIKHVRNMLQKKIIRVKQLLGQMKRIF